MAKQLKNNVRIMIVEINEFSVSDDGDYCGVYMRQRKGSSTFDSAGAQANVIQSSSGLASTPMMNPGKLKERARHQ